MTKVYLLAITFMLMVAQQQAFAQTDTQADLENVKTTPNQSVNFHLLGLNYNYELPLGGKWAVNLHAGIEGGVSYEHISYNFNGYEHSESQWRGLIALSTGADFRYYYNLKMRAAKGKSIRGNSAQFIAADIQYITPKIAAFNNAHSDGGIMIAPYWGFKKVYKSNWLIEFNTGIYVGKMAIDLIDQDNIAFGPKLDFKVGYCF